MKLEAIIVEDEARSREILSGYLDRYCPNVRVVGEATNVEEAMVEIRAKQPDLIFLDVEMPFGNAFDLLEKVGQRSFETIFVTAYEQYAMDALNAHASFYLLKPIAIDKLIEAVDYVIGVKEKEDRLQRAILRPRKEPASGKITIPRQSGFEVLESSEILYCQADDNYTHIHLKQGGSRLVSKTLKHFEEILGPKGFARVHKSFLVNVAEVVAYQKGKGGSVELSNGKQIMVSPSRKNDLLSYFD